MSRVRDVAQVAGVSVATVYKKLKNNPASSGKGGIGGENRIPIKLLRKRRKNSGQEHSGNCSGKHFESFL